MQRSSEQSAYDCNPAQRGTSLQIGVPWMAWILCSMVSTRSQLHKPGLALRYDRDDQLDQASILAWKSTLSAWMYLLSHVWYEQRAYATEILTMLCRAACNESRVQRPQLNSCRAGSSRWRRQLGALQFEHVTSVETGEPTTCELLHWQICRLCKQTSSDSCVATARHLANQKLPVEHCRRPRLI